MNNKRLTRKDIAYNNLYFWYNYIIRFRGHDDQKEINLDEVINDEIGLDADRYIPDIDQWLESFYPEEEADHDGIYENPNVIAGQLTDEMSFAIEFHLSETRFSLNDCYIGNLGGHFEVKFLTLQELLAFEKYEALFLLLLPMAGVTEDERLQAESLVSQKLKLIELFSEQPDYLAKCIVNGLIVDEPFRKIVGIGLTCNANHSVRNVEKYPRYTTDVIKINQALASFVQLSKE